MEIILKADVENLGYKDQIVNVKAGYANNYLIPQGLAANATASAKKAHAENLRQRAHKEEKIVGDAQKVASKIAGSTVVITVNSNASGKIFGSVTTVDIAEAIAAKGVEVDKRNIRVASIKEVGTYTATVRIYKEVVAEVTVEVISSEPVATPEPVVSEEVKVVAEEVAQPEAEVEA